MCEKLVGLVNENLRSHLFVHSGTMYVQMSDWPEVRCLTRDDWKSITPESGEQSAMIISTTSMPALSAIVLDVDTGWYSICLIISLFKLKYCLELSGANVHENIRIPVGARPSGRLTIFGGFGSN